MADRITTNGTFIISLDFELHWGIFENKKNDYESLFKSTREGIELLLDLFKEHKVHATWATVGMLFSSTKAELQSFSPTKKPEYQKPNISAYNIINEIGDSEKDDISHFANSLIKKIQQIPFQEIASHTFSHYYACEDGQTLADFEKDCIAMRDIAGKYNIDLSSIVFPRNQINKEYLTLLYSLGILTVRSNPDTWFYNASKPASQYNSYPYKIMRAIDLIAPICNTLFPTPNIPKGRPLYIPASRFLRPYKSSDFIFNSFKLRRIKSEMTNAAKNKLNYHLWWHPHNFGHELEKNIEYLKSILEHYDFLKEKYGYESLNMREFYEHCK